MNGIQVKLMRMKRAYEGGFGTFCRRTILGRVGFRGNRKMMY